MSWPEDAYWTLADIDKDGETHEKTVLLVNGRTGWRGGILSLTYLGDYTTELLTSLEKTAVVNYGFEQGTGEMELLVMKAKDLPDVLRKELHGFVGGLEVPLPVGDEFIALLVDATPMHQDAMTDLVYTCAVYWLHFHFE
jgi:hypothetical protein